MSEYYYALHIKPSQRYDLFLQLALSLVPWGLEESNGTIIIRSEYNLETIKEGIEEFSQQLKISCEIQSYQLKNKDWIEQYQHSIKPVKVGRFFIHPTWYEPCTDYLNIIIDPALCFGSGHHETTASCLTALSSYVKKGDSVLDIGTGSGILSIAASKLQAIVDFCDTDELALQSAKENFIKNEVTFNHSWVGSVSSCQKQYDVVIANIVADVLLILAKDIKNSLAKGALLILSGILTKHKQTILNAYGDCELIDEIIENEWTTMIFRSNG